MKFKEKALAETSDFWYDLTDGGYIKPKDLLENEEEAIEVEKAISLIKQFYDEAVDCDVIVEL